MIVGLASAFVLFAYAWWAPFALAGAWLATHWLLRESSGWGDAAVAAGRLTVLVSHRFSTVRMADLIVVLDGSRVRKSGATRS